MALRTEAQSPLGLPGTAVLQHDLRQVRYLLDIFRSLPADEAGNSEDMVWLRNRERFLRAVLVSRGTMCRSKVVDLAQWRRGATAA